MELKLDNTKEYGIVLEGGGAKGAYQIGAWKALKEAGIRINSVVGVSVGALNGALICMDDLESAWTIWENIDVSQVMVREEDKLKQVKQILVDGGFDISPLKQLIDRYIDEEAIRNSNVEFYVTTLSVTDRKLLRVHVKELPDGEIADTLLASAYFPVFKSEKVRGKRYVDAGGLNNVPIDVLLDEGYKDLIVIRIYGLGFDKEKVVEIPKDVTVTHIAPRQDLGGILEFDRKRSRKNMKLGYLDAKRMLYGLEGRRYYLDAPESETYYFSRLMAEAVKGGWNGEENAELDGCRRYTEEIFPEMAKKLKLRDKWNYKELYLALLEEKAKLFKIDRFKIYTVEELLRKINRKQCALDRKARM